MHLFGDVQILATFQGEVADNGSPSGIMTGSAAMVTGSYEDGTVYAISPHPESTLSATFLIESITVKIAKDSQHADSPSSAATPRLPAPGPDLSK